MMIVLETTRNSVAFTGEFLTSLAKEMKDMSPGIEDMSPGMNIGMGMLLSKKLEIPHAEF